jgi:hypothetical protein
MVQVLNIVGCLVICVEGPSVVFDSVLDAPETTEAADASSWSNPLSSFARVSQLD